MDRDQKTAVVDELAGELKESAAIFAVDYRGISVPQAAELRASLRDADTQFRVVKNRLTLRAADEAGTDGIKDFLSGPTALAFVKGDAALAAKTLNRLGGEWELLEYKGGLMDGEALDPDSFKAIARLPGREALNAQLAGVVASPLTGLVRGLGSMIQGLALQLGQIAEQGLVTGEAPAETPAEETPADEKAAEEEETPKQEETPKEVAAPAAGGDEADSGDEDAAGEEAASDGEADAPPAEDDSSDGEADQPEAEASDPDPEPTESPEETSEEEAPEGEDAGQGEADGTGEGDQDLGEEPSEDSKEDEAPAGEAEDASSDEKETDS
jgi:large subunit ribosomal protein L10